MRKIRLANLNRCHKQIVAIVCLTLIGCIYIQQNMFQSNHVYVELQGDSSTCTPRSNIVFLKAHKCASSTIQNIFMRYGYFHHKIFVLPKAGNYLGHPRLFQKTMVPKVALTTGQYNILTHHTRFNYEEMRYLMPSDTLFISIIRDPVKLFESMFAYYKLDRIYKFNFTDINNSNFEFPEKIYKFRFATRIGINQMSFDMGMDQANFFDTAKIVEYIEKLDSIYSLVMMSERMDESLILLKNLLCWTYDDMVVFKVNARKASLKSNITEEGANKIRKLNKADQMLYEHFSAKFDSMVRNFGVKRMREEIKELHDITDYYFRYCVNTTVASNTAIVRFQNQKKNDLNCHFLTESELSLTSFIRDKQFAKNPWSIHPNKTKS